MPKRASARSVAKKPPTNATGESLIDSRNVASMLGVTRYHVWELVRLGGIPFVRIGRRQVRFVPAKIREWIEGGGTSQVRAG